MPQTPERKAEYQRARRAQAKTGQSSPTNDSSEGIRQAAVARTKLQGTPFRNQNGELVLDRGSGVDRGNSHYWGWVSKAPEGARICLEFEFGPGNWIGGCGEVRAWEGKELNTRLDGAVDSLGKVITDSPHFKEIYEKMPRQKERAYR